MISFHSRPSQVLAAIVTACAGALAAGCGSSATSTPGTTVTVTPPTSQPTTAPASSPASSSLAGPAPCPTRDLRVRPGLAQGAAGSTYQIIDFTNIGTVTCTLYGYPGVSLAGGSPISQIGQAADENSATPRQLVTLAPGQVANALLRIVRAENYPTSTCRPKTARYLQIFPPNQTTPVYLAYGATACASRHVHLLTINAMRPGSGG